MCTSPRSAGYDSAGKITFSKKLYNKEISSFQVPCGKCTECRLEKAREWAVRCQHEASMVQESCFITLTYSPENLPKSGKLCYPDFQLFMKKLRERKEFKHLDIGFLMCGEYGEQKLRPHYHALLFGIDFPDKKKERENHLQQPCYSSALLNDIWGLGHTELGSVTLQSASYVARYTLKKTGSDQGLEPFLRSSKKRPPGKAWIAKYWQSVFSTGTLVVPSEDSYVKSKIPRYYEKWLKDHQPDYWSRYVTEIKPVVHERLRNKAEAEHAVYVQETQARGLRAWSYKTPLARKREILKERVKTLRRQYDPE